MLLDTLDASLLGNLLTGKETISGRVHLELLKALLEQVRIFNAVSFFNTFETQKYYQNESKVNGVFSRNNLPKIKDGGICNKS